MKFCILILSLFLIEDSMANSSRNIGSRQGRPSKPVFRTSTRKKPAPRNVPRTRHSPRPVPRTHKPLPPMSDHFPKPPRQTPTPAPRRPAPVVIRHRPLPQAPKYPKRPANVRRSGMDFGTSRYHRPFGYTPVPYFQYTHIPYNSPDAHNSHYATSTEWHTFIKNNFPNFVYANWIFYPAANIKSGYVVLDNYPHYVYNGFRYRYSYEDRCNYQLVDSYNHRVIKSYWDLSCTHGYDQCSSLRDMKNDNIGEFRFLCAETIKNINDPEETPSYDHTNYDNGTYCEDKNKDGFCDN